MDLREYLFRNKIAKKIFADKVGVNPGYLCNLANGLYTPSLQLAVRIMRETNGQVRPEDWIKEENKQHTE